MEEQVQELRTELERKKSRIEYLTRMVEENQRGKSELRTGLGGWWSIFRISKEGSCPR